MPAPHRDVDLVERGYRHVAKTGIFRVAVLDDRVVSLACAIVRGTHWFLSGFWTEPTLRLGGIGGPLLREVFDAGRERGTRAHFVWASIDHAAIAAYLKVGMLPGTQLFAFGGPQRLGLAAARERAGRVDAFDAARVARLDEDAVGFRRDEDHAYWLARDGARAALVSIGGEDVGYYHVHHGTVGPMMWSRDQDADVVLSAATRDAKADSNEVQLTVPGSNHVALRFALGAGLRLIRQSHLLWTDPVGHMERYVPSGPLLF